ncbi:MAG: hypothetical protein CMF60_01210 [Magnetococcales bacterium]|nr:hypothetical protein [Magnetococcales bacterium]|tara:strand:- start:1918 stop:2886 length:969 start_codon:yes stop_codon:yes gene_type:complete
MKKSTYSTYSTSPSKAYLKWAGVIVVFGFFIFLLWYATANRDSIIKSEDDLEVIMPSAQAVKVRADDPGGMEVDNRDKQVFNLLDSSLPEEEIEREDLCAGEESATLCNKQLPKVTALAADPKVAEQKAAEMKLRPKSPDIALLIENYEVSAPVTQTAESASEEPKQQKVAQQEIEEAEVESQSAESVEPQAVAKVQKPVVPAQQSTEKKQSETVAKKVEKPTEPAQLKLAAEKDLFVEGAWGVQLASYRNLTGADAGAKIFQKRYPEILKPLTYVTEKVEIKGKGTFYRVQFIGLKDKASAQKACASIKSKGKDGCWHVSR